MNRTMISSDKLTVRIRRGSEGPRHDPYSYTEYCVTTPHGETVLHQGLGTWLKHEGHDVEADGGMRWDAKEQWLVTRGFPLFTGWTLAQLERLDRKLHSRCAKCGSKKFYCVAGYPGESLEVCSNCENIHDSTFNESAII